MSHPEERARAALVSVSRRLHSAGWVANHDGNASARLDDGRILATPTAVSKAEVSAESLVTLNDEGAVIAGTRKVFSEIALHRCAYRVREDVSAVLHAHPPYATAMAVAGVGLGAPFMAEPVVSLGREIPLIPHLLPGEDDGELAEALTRADAVLLGNHGVLTVGPDLETCLLRMELVEHLAKIFTLSLPHGGPKALDEGLVDTLQAKHEQLFPKRLRDSARSHVEDDAPSAPLARAQDVVKDALSRFR
ncbi:MAG: class II aldolase/adducin family protein [Deltaproteobacteria bacterium]|nr:class II aldolase/adducin family protein [Deltaproteobacteria bacterium]